LTQPKPTLDSAFAKLDHSLSILRQLEREIDEDRAENERTGFQPVELTMGWEVDEEGLQWQVARCAKVNRHPPERWTLLAGDAMHNARTALDHLAARLVELQGNDPEKAAFPIFDSPPTAKNQWLFDRALEGMSRAHREAIVALQPYKNPQTQESDILLALQDLDNLDKHRDKIPMLSTGGSTPASLSYKYGAATVRWLPNAEVKPDAIIFAVRSLTPIGHIQVGVAFRVTFGDPSIGVTELHKIRTYCVGIVASFRPDFA
jgi:hypothetical protein